MMKRRHFFEMPQARKHATAALIVLLGTGVMAPVPARAGFEWVPPAKVVPPAPQQQAAPSMAPAPQQQYQSYDAQPAPTNPVSPYAGAEQFANPVAPMAPPAASASDLVINPYPVTRGSYSDVMMGVGPVEQAMMGASQALHPVQLPGGLSTSGKVRALRPSYPSAAPQQQAMQAPANIIPPGNTAMSAMPGGNPAPLPNYTAAPIAPAPVAAAPIMDMSPQPAAMQPVPRPPEVAMKAAQKIKQPPVQRPVAEAAPAVANSQYKEAVGFGNDLPLALALSQVIPEDYALFFETKVDADSTSVSWEGGKPWNEVLQEMLAPLGLRAEIQPNLVMIRGA